MTRVIAIECSPLTGLNRGRHNRGFCGVKTLMPSESDMKRTFQPSVVKRKRTHGFLVRMRSRSGAAVIRARRAKGRARLAV